MVCCLAGTATAQSISFSADVPNQGGEWVYGFSLPQFDASIGSLESIELRVDAQFDGFFEFENRSFTLPLQVSNLRRSWDFRFGPTGATPVISMLETWAPDGFTLATNDGVVDFDGPGGVTIGYKGGAQATSFITDFTGYIGSGTIDYSASLLTPFSFDTVGGSYFFGAFANAAATVTITYNYVPTPGALGVLGLGACFAARRRR
jgi:hypothetical protein